MSQEHFKCSSLLRPCTALRVGNVKMCVVFPRTWPWYAQRARSIRITWPVRVRLWQWTIAVTLVKPRSFGLNERQRAHSVPVRRVGSRNSAVELLFWSPLLTLLAVICLHIWEIGVFVLAAAEPVLTDFACVLRFWCLVSPVKAALDTFERSCDLF